MSFCVSPSVPPQPFLQPSATQSLLSHISPSVFPQPPLSGTATCCEPAPLGHGDPLALSPASDPIIPPRTDSSTSAPSSLNSSCNHQAFSSAGLPWTISSTWIRHLLKNATDLWAVRCSPALHPSTPMAPFGSALPQAPPLPLVAPAPLQPSGISILSWVVFTAALSWPPGLSVSLCSFGSLSALRAPSPLAQPPPLSMA